MQLYGLKFPGLPPPTAWLAARLPAAGRQPCRRRRAPQQGLQLQEERVPEKVGECFQAGIVCSDNCKCLDCKNYEGSEARDALVSPQVGGVGGWQGK